MAFQKKKWEGFLPQDWPGWLATASLGFQHYLAIFPATVLVPFLVGFNVSTTLFAAGLATLVALAVNRWRIPLFYGSSFAGIAPIIAAVVAVRASGGSVQDAVRVAQVGIFVAGLAQILIGWWIYRAGPERVYRVLPPVVSGPVAMTIAYGLAAAAIDMASGMCCLTNELGQPMASLRWWIVAVITCLTTVFWSWRLKGRGLLGMLPILGGAVVGYLVAIPFGLVNLSSFAQARLLRFPQVALPYFNHPLAITAILSIVPAVIATIPESLAHLLQIDGAIQKIAEKAERKTESLKSLVGINQISDGFGDVVCGLFGGVMGTNYGETIATVVISRAATIYAIVFAAVFAVVSSFSGHLEALVQSIPTAVAGGLALYLFGAFGVVGIKMLLEVKEDLLEVKNVALISLILIIGIGGGNKYGGSLPIPLPTWLATFFPGGIPAIATAALLGIGLNFLFNRFPVKDQS